MTRIGSLLIAGVVLLAGAGEARAAQRVHVGGVTLTVPSAVVSGSQDVVPGTPIAVRVVRNPDHRRTVVTLREDLKTTLESKALRRGAFRAKAGTNPASGNRLRIRVGGHRRTYRFGVSQAKASANLTVTAPSVRAGDAVVAVVTNTGRPSLYVNDQVRWEAKQADGSYVAVPPISGSLSLVDPGASHALPGQLPAGLAPGVYRATTDAHAGLRSFDLHSPDFTVTG